MDRNSLYRLSHSFPPNYKNNNKYLAKVHSLVKKLPPDFDPSQVYYRPVQDLDELQEVKLLHKEWFPPNYPEEFYQQLLINKYYRSILALYDIENKNQKITLVLGCITYEYKEVDYDIVNFSISDWFMEKRAIYILTFGVINEVRNKGIGSDLLRQLIKVGEEDPLVKCVYLDVVAYNDIGVKCYQKNGFSYVCTQKNHYEIFGEEYDALVFSYYINGARKPRSVGEIVLDCLTIGWLPCRGVNGIKRCMKRRKKNNKDKEALANHLKKA